MARLLGGLTTVIVYLAAATFFAQLIVLAHLWFTYDMDRERLSQIAAIAMGVNVFDEEQVREKLLADTGKEVLLQEVIEERARNKRDFEARELLIKTLSDQVRANRERLEREQRDFYAVVRNFEAKMKDLEEGERKKGLDEITIILAAIKPEQAKDQIVRMLDFGEIDTVVLAFRAMDERKRTKIIEEMRTDVEEEQLQEILWMIREGEPMASDAREAAENLPNVPQGPASPVGAGP